MLSAHRHTAPTSHNTLPLTPAHARLRSAVQGHGKVIEMSISSGVRELIRDLD